MNFSTHNINWFDFVPQYGGNRDLPESERMSLQIRRIPTSVVMAQGNTDGNVFAWKKKQLDRMAHNDNFSEEVISSFKNMEQAGLSDLRQFCNYSRDFKNIAVDGVTLTDPLEVALLVPLSKCEETGETLFHEILYAQNEAMTLEGDSLKNFVSACAGKDKATPSDGETEESSAETV